MYGFLAPPAGLEPATSWLTVMRSTDWAKEEYKIRRRPTFPGSLPPSIISTAELNFRVRDGNGWDLCVIITGFIWMLVSQHLWSYFIVPSKLNNTWNTILSLLHIFFSFWSSPRSISTGQLNTLLHLHLQPINHIIYVGTYCFRMGYLILRLASRLDAFSVYPIHTWLPSRALGRTTGAPEVCPSRSSRTKDSSSQISYARDR